MDCTQKDSLRRNHVTFVDELDPRDIIDNLREDGVLTENDYEHIRAENTRKDRCRLLLAMLPTRGPVAYGSFQTALKTKYYHLVHLLCDTNRTEHLQCPARVPLEHDQRLPAPHMEADGTNLAGKAKSAMVDDDSFKACYKCRPLIPEFASAHLANVVNENCCLILENVEVKDLLDLHYQEYVFGGDECERIKCGKTRKDRCTLFLWELSKCQRNEVLSVFIKSLKKKYNYIFKDIEKTLRRSTELSNGLREYKSFQNDIGTPRREAKYSCFKDRAGVDCADGFQNTNITHMDSQVFGAHMHPLYLRDPFPSSIYDSLPKKSFHRTKNDFPEDDVEWMVRRNRVLKEKHDLFDTRSHLILPAPPSSVGLAIDTGYGECEPPSYVGLAIDTGYGECEPPSYVGLAIDTGYGEFEPPSSVDLAIDTGYGECERPFSVGLAIDTGYGEFEPPSSVGLAIDTDYGECELKSTERNGRFHHNRRDNILFADLENESKLCIGRRMSGIDSQQKDKESDIIRGPGTCPSSSVCDNKSVTQSNNAIQSETDIFVLDSFSEKEVFQDDDPSADEKDTTSKQRASPNKQDSVEVERENIVDNTLDLRNKDEHVNPTICAMAVRMETNPSTIGHYPGSLEPGALRSKRLEVAFNFLSTTINQGQYNKFERFAVNLQQNYSHDSDLMCILDYLHASRNLVSADVNAAKRHIKSGLQRVSKTSNIPRYFTLEFFSAKSRMYLTHKRRQKFQDTLDDAKMIIEADPVGCTGRAAGWLYVNDVRETTANIAMLNVHSPHFHASHKSLHDKAVRSCQKALENFQRDGGKDGPFGFGFGLCRLSILLLRCGHNGLTMDVLHPDSEDIDLAGGYLRQLEDSDIPIPRILEVHYLLARCDYQYRRGHTVRALEHAEAAHRLATEISMLEFTEHAHNRVIFLRTKAPLVIEDVDEEASMILFWNTLDNGD